MERIGVIYKVGKALGFGSTNLANPVIRIFTSLRSLCVVANLVTTQSDRHQDKLHVRTKCTLEPV
jgi:hypothetical protein